MKFKKILLYSLILIALFCIYVLYSLFSNNTNFDEKQKIIFVPTGSNYENLLSNLKEQQCLKSISSFEGLADKMNLKNHIHPGKYKIENGMGNYSIVAMFRSGKQQPVKLVINKLRTKQDLIRKISKQLEADSNELKKLFSDNEFLKQYEIDSNQIQCLIIPDTYEFKWNTDAKKTIEKLAKGAASFWNNERLAKAKKMNMSKVQIVTMASIVEEESNIKEDKYKIASTYLNRIKIGMPLQADPTCKFAVGNFGLKRILKIHTEINSPYNTYKSQGLPPGPICTPSKETIDAVLNAPKTDYIYFCAREDLKGYSNFATNYQEHLANAKKYQDALNKRGIK
jgi:UPF0755 protein